MEALNSSLNASLNSTMDSSLDGSLNGSSFFEMFGEKENPLVEDVASPHKRTGKILGGSGKMASSPLGIPSGSPRTWKEGAKRMGRLGGEREMMDASNVSSVASSVASSFNDSSILGMMHDESANAVKGGTEAVALVEQAFLEMESQLRALERRPKALPLRGTPGREGAPGSPRTPRTPGTPGSPFRTEVDKAKQLHQAQVELAKVRRDKEAAEAEVARLQAELEAKTSSNEENSGMVMSLTAQIADRMDDIAELESKVTILQQTLESVQQSERDTKREVRLRRKLNANLKAAFGTRGLGPESEAQAEAAHLRVKYEDVKQRYFAMIALALKLSYAMSGLAINKLDTNAVYHQLVQDNVDESEWPRVIQMYFESELTPGPRSIN